MGCSSFSKRHRIVQVIGLFAVSGRTVCGFERALWIVASMAASAGLVNASLGLVWRGFRQHQRPNFVAVLGNLVLPT
jgi:hypothetical protein